MSLLNNLVKNASRWSRVKRNLKGAGKIAAGAGAAGGLVGTGIYAGDKLVDHIYDTKQKELEKNINIYKPRTNVDRDLISQMKSRVLDLDDDSSKGYATNDFDKSVKFPGRYSLPIDDFASEFRSNKKFGQNVYDLFEGRGIERTKIPGNNVINARLNQDALRAEILGGSDLAKRVVYWSGNNSLHNRYNQMRNGDKRHLVSLLKKYDVKVPHRNSIALGLTPGNNIPNSWFVAGKPDITLGRQFLQDGILDASLGIKTDESEKNNWTGLHSPQGNFKGGRHIPSVNVVGIGPDQNSIYNSIFDAFNNYTESITRPYAQKGDYYSIRGLDSKNSGTIGHMAYFKNGWNHPGAFLHEISHSETPNAGSGYDKTNETDSIGFSNPTAYAGRSVSETVRAMQSGKIPITRMLMDKVERLAPEIVPNYSKLSPKDQLDIKAQIIAQLAEDPEIALVTLKRWGAFNPDRPNREEGLEYYIPKAYLTNTTQLNDEIVNALVGLNRSFVPEQGGNPKWKQFWNLIYPQLIARNKNDKNDRNNIV